MASRILPLLLFATTVPTSLTSGVLFNVALYKPAFQSSDFPFYDAGFMTADLANDGSDDSYLDNRHCQSTDNDSIGWWMVDLRGMYVVEQIVLTSSIDDGTLNRTKNYQLDVFLTDPRLSRDFPLESGQVCYSRTEPLGLGETYVRNCTAPLTGRFVRFVRYTQDHTTICEVKVMASRVLSTETRYTRMSNVVLPKYTLYTVYVAKSIECLTRCLQLRDSDACTGVNWIRSTHECQLMTLDPRQADITSYLQSNSDADFYMEM